MNQKAFVKRLLAVALNLIMVLGLMPMTAFAADGTYTFTPSTQSGNNTSTIEYSLTDENAGDVTFIQHYREIELVLMLDEGWYFEKWDTYFDGYEDVALWSDPEIKGVNPKPDNGGYTFLIKTETTPLTKMKAPLTTVTTAVPKLKTGLKQYVSAAPRPITVATPLPPF